MLSLVRHASFSLDSGLSLTIFVAASRSFLVGENDDVFAGHPDFCRRIWIANGGVTLSGFNVELGGALSHLLPAMSSPFRRNWRAQF